MGGYGTACLYWIANGRLMEVCQALGRQKRADTVVVLAAAAAAAAVKLKPTKIVYFHDIECQRIIK